MASIINQSRYVVKVPRRPNLTREFPHTKKAKALEYQNSLRSLTRVPASIEQLSNQLFVRVRRRGRPEQARLPLRRRSRSNSIMPPNKAVGYLSTMPAPGL
jgi:hypothetical protein